MTKFIRGLIYDKFAGDANRYVQEKLKANVSPYGLLAAKQSHDVDIILDRLDMGKATEAEVRAVVEFDTNVTSLLLPMLTSEQLLLFMESKKLTRKLRDPITPEFILDRLRAKSEQTIQERTRKRRDKER